MIFKDGQWCYSILPILPQTLTCCHGNEIWDKKGYNSVCVRNICEISASIGGVSGIGRDQLNSQFHGRDIFREIGLLP